MIEIYKNDASRGCENSSPEGGILFDATTKTVITIFQSNVISNATTGLHLWQSESRDAGLTWTAVHPLIIPSLTAADVTSKTHVPPGSGIQLRASGSKFPGRLMVVLILQAGCTEDVVLYSDNGGASWEMSRTRLPNNGEAQVAELAANEIIFDGRSKKGNKRGVASSDDGGETFFNRRFVADKTSGVSCLASLLALPVPVPTRTDLAAVPTPSPPPTGQCSPSAYLQNTTTKQSGGTILQQFLTTSADECCAGCANLTSCGAWTLATAHHGDHKPTTCYLLSALTTPTKRCAWCTSGLSGTPPPPPPSPTPPAPGMLAPLLFSHPAGTDRTKGVVLRSDDGAKTWTEMASATPEAPSSTFGYSSLTVLEGGGVGLTYEAGASSCTADTSACNIMYRNVTVQRGI
jgi:hypothetical protein